MDPEVRIPPRYLEPPRRDALMPEKEKDEDTRFVKIVMVFIIIVILVGAGLYYITFVLQEDEDEDEEEELIEPDTIELELVADGLVSPLGMAHPDDGTGRLFIVDQTGKIWILDENGDLLEEPFLDIPERMVDLMPDFDERGLLGLAFHPDHSENGRFFVYYSAPLREEAPDDWNHTSHISEFSVSSDPDRADHDSERIIMQVDQPQFNHDGGQLLFGPDGYLYISLGDGGQANDVGTGHPPEGNAQNETTLLGSILRIDVDGEEPYDIPEDNPFVGQEGRDEIFAYGLRNPWRMSFGPDGRLFVGDVGQNGFEEVSIVERGGNYGWNIREGTHCFDPDNPNDPPDECPTEDAEGDPLIPPIIEYGNANNDGIGLAVIGGFLYEGDDLEGYDDVYIFGDWSSSFSEPRGILFYAIPPDDGDLWIMDRLPLTTGTEGRLDEFLLGFGEDADGEIFVLTSGTGGPAGNTGRVYRLVPA